MSVVKKTAKVSLGLLSLFVLVFIGGAIYLYINMNSIAKTLSEDIATKALGVEVALGDIDISLEDKKITVTDISIANPEGYKKDEAIHVGSVVIAAETLSQGLLSFALVEVDGTVVNLEVRQGGTNLGDIRNYIQQTSATTAGAKTIEVAPTPEEQIKVIVRKFTMSKAQLNPSVTLIDRDLAFIKVPDINLEGIGEKKNGVVAQEAVAQIMEEVLQAFNKSATKAGFLEGLSLDALNDIGVSTVDVFKKNLKESYDKDVEQLKEGVDNLKNMFK